MSRPWTPQRPQWICTCGHPVEDHGAEPDLPCLLCDVCNQFCENRTPPMFDLGEKT